MAENVIIRPGVLFKDRSGCLLKMSRQCASSPFSSRCFTELTNSPLSGGALEVAMAIRLSKQSIIHLKIADFVIFEQTERGGYLVEVNYLEGCRTYLHGSDIIEYPSLKHAKRQVLRHAPHVRFCVMRF